MTRLDFLFPSRLLRAAYPTLSFPFHSWTVPDPDVSAGLIMAVTRTRSTDLLILQWVQGKKCATAWFTTDRILPAFNMITGLIIWLIISLILPFTNTGSQRRWNLYFLTSSLLNDGDSEWNLVHSLLRSWWFKNSAFYIQGSRDSHRNIHHI